MIKKLIFSIFLIFLLFFLAIKPIQAAYFQFDPTTVNVNAGETFTVKVNINTENEEVNGTDIFIKFDANLLQAQQVNAGSFFPTVTNDISSNMVYIAALVDDPASPKNGTGEVASVTFKTLTNGSGKVSFDCDQSRIVKNDANGTNLLNCNLNNKVSLTIGGEDSSSSNNSSNSSSSNNSTPSSLPKSGVVDILIKYGAPGLILFSLGILSKILLKY